jgi:hypothetical protein
MLGSNVPNLEVRGQLACPMVKRKHKKRSCESFMCPCVHVVCAPMMFTCIKDLRPLVVKGGLNM